ncbi:Hypothetical predicted protein [Mytilus galloprovincialis]|nr:Hypothetical predicted protein [Mytilus galloprovincialis]
MTVYYKLLIFLIFLLSGGLANNAFTTDITSTLPLQPPHVKDSVNTGLIAGIIFAMVFLAVVVMCISLVVRRRRAA